LTAMPIRVAHPLAHKSKHASFILPDSCLFPVEFDPVKEEMLSDLDHTPHGQLDPRQASKQTNMVGFRDLPDFRIRPTRRLLPRLHHHTRHLRRSDLIRPSQLPHLLNHVLPSPPTVVRNRSRPTGELELDSPFDV
jgi:hypothetical protein